MVDDKKYWHNKFGLRYWRHKTLPYELERFSKDADIIFINVFENGERIYFNHMQYSQIKYINYYIIDGVKLRYEDFEPIDKNYYRRKKLERIMINE